MNRRLIFAAGAVALIATASLPAAAAPKVKPFKGTYKLMLLPDPTGEAGVEGAPRSPAGLPSGPRWGSGCTSTTQAAGAQQKSVNRKLLSIPGKGTLKVNLLALDPSNGAALIDWDLHIETPNGSSSLSKSVGQGSNEQTLTKFKKATKIAIEVCNYTGHPNATVTYSFKP